MLANFGEFKRVICFALLCLSLTSVHLAKAQVRNGGTDGLPKDFTPPSTVVPPSHPVQVSQPQPAPPPPPPPPPPSPAPTPPPLVSSQAQLHPPVSPFTPSVVVPTDVTHQSFAPGLIPPGLPPVYEGIEVLADNRFPDDAGKQNTDGILVRARENTVMERTSPHSVKLVSGSILVSVRRPSQLGLVNTTLGDLALSSDGEILVSSSNGVLHVMNASARGAGCKIRLQSGEFREAKKRTFAVKPGFEFVAGKSKLTRTDLRPVDGIARRRSQVFEDGRIALSEFSVQSVLSGSDLIANLNQKDSGSKEKRILADLSKMAAVLNYVNGAQGYSCAGPTRVAAASADKTQ